MNTNKNITPTFLQQKPGSKKRNSFYNKKINSKLKTPGILLKKNFSSSGKKV